MFANVTQVTQLWELHQNSVLPGPKCKKGSEEPFCKCLGRTQWHVGIVFGVWTQKQASVYPDYG
jgi:hypothetical protein